RGVVVRGARLGYAARRDPDRARAGTVPGHGRVAPGTSARGRTGGGTRTRGRGGGAFQRAPGGSRAGRALLRPVRRGPVLRSVDVTALENELTAAAATRTKLRGAIGEVVVGQDEVVDQVLWALVAGGHVLLEGAPGLGKTLIVRTLSACLDLRFSRIQFTP